jgi:TetR/AcrR family transcriptional regulator, tetracycline repressor protein
LGGGGTRARERGSLTREEIVREALALLEEQGPGSLSMRKVADRVGVAPNALYTHVRGKADLVDALIDQVYAGLELDPDRSGDWREQLATLAAALRRHLLDYPALVPLALQQPGLGPNSLRLGEEIYAILRPAGFPDHVVVGAVYAMLTYILGFVALEIPRAGATPEDSDEFVRQMRAFFTTLPVSMLPHTVELAPLLAHISTDDQFEQGMTIFLDGLASRQPSSGSNSGSADAPVPEDRGGTVDRGRGVRGR